MKYFLIAMLWASPLWAFEEDPNWYIKHCKNQIEFDKTQDWNKLSACTGKFVNARQEQKHQELRDFIRANPRYRFPGQSLNRCFGKDREMPFKSVDSSMEPAGWKVTVTYKDRIKKCYQTSGWDNRDVGS